MLWHVRTALFIVALCACSAPSTIVRRAPSGERDSECHPGYTLGDARCPLRHRVQRTVRAVDGALVWAEPRSSTAYLACAVDDGQLGCAHVEDDGFPDGPSRAIAPIGPSDVWALGAGGGCIARQAREVECWTDQALDVVSVGRLPRPALEIGMGMTLACARLDDSSVWCWDVSPWAPPRIERRAVPPARRILTGAGYACADTSDGFWCWGSLGIDWVTAHALCVLCSGHTPGHEVIGPPTRLAGAVVHAAASATRVCVSEEGGSVRCWEGYRPSCSGSQDHGPVSIPELAGAVELALDEAAVCARMASGRVRCVLDGTAVPDADDEVRSSRAVIDIELPAPATRLWSGGRFGCAVLSDGAQSCWRLDALAPEGWLNRTDRASAPE